MMAIEKYLKVFYFLAAISGIVFPTVILASQTNGTVSGYAWSSQIGWVNFGTTNGNIHITDSAMTGYAWNENVGWLNLNPTNSGVQNDGNGTLSGYGWLEGMGWINFSGVSVNSSGIFSGTATGDNSVSINFGCSNCGVSTDWRSSSVRGSDGGGGSGGGGAIPPSVNFVINEGQKYSNNPSVRIFFLNSFDSSDKIIISNSSDMSGGAELQFQNNVSWILSSGDGEKNVYARVYPKYGAPSEIAKAGIYLDTLPPEINLLETKEKYKTGEQISLKGLTESEAEITLSKDDRAGLFSADSNGNWDVSLGKLIEGKHYVELVPRDQAGNVGVPLRVEILVEQEKEIIIEEKKSIFEKIKEIIEPILPKFLNSEKEEKEENIALIPKIAPVSMRGAFRYIDEVALERLVLAPLPNDFQDLALKFPKLKKTFEKTGVRKFTDIGKLENAKLKLPGLTELILSANTMGQESVRGISLSDLSESAISRMPFGVIFVKSGGGLVDIGAVLSLSEEGTAIQSIQTIAGQKLQLIVKIESPAETVSGYLVFKSKNISEPPVSRQNIFSRFLSAAENVLPFSIESAQAAEKENDGEKRLMLEKFEYENKGYGVYFATIDSPAIEGLYEIITEINYKDFPAEEIKLLTIVDPEGYIYKKSGNMEARIFGAETSLYWLNLETGSYELWPAKEYQQENPQITDKKGTYSFLVPEGRYYLQVKASGYAEWKGDPFDVREGSGIHINIGMSPNGWRQMTLDWKVVLLLAILILLFYNFYRDKIRERKINQ